MGGFFVCSDSERKSRHEVGGGGGRRVKQRPWSYKTRRPNMRKGKGEVRNIGWHEKKKEEERNNSSQHHIYINTKEKREEGGLILIWVFLSPWLTWEGGERVLVLLKRIARHKSTAPTTANVSSTTTNKGDRGRERPPFPSSSTLFTLSYKNPLPPLPFVRRCCMVCNIMWVH